MTVTEDLRGFYAGFVSRLVAFIVDSIVISVSVGVAAGIISTVFSVISLQGTIDFPGLSGAFTFALASTLVVVYIVLYFIVFWSIGGRTPGKALIGLRVVTTDGRELNLLRAAMRFIGYVVCTITLFLGFVMILADNRRQGLHDKLARTLVVYDWEARHGERLARALAERGEKETTEPQA